MFFGGHATRQLWTEDTTTPEFFSTDEKDVQFPQESRLEISIRDVDDMGLGRDTLIGSTVIDLEDRWHSPKWKEIIQSRKVMPSEVRSLYTPAEPGWIVRMREMHVSVICLWMLQSLFRVLFLFLLLSDIVFVKVRDPVNV